MNKIEYIKAQGIMKTLAFQLANVKFETVTLADTGDVINISAREVGAEVFAGEGEAVADGTYVLSDGFEFEVKDSLISKVISEVKVADEVTEELAEEVPASDEPSAKDEEFKTLQDEVAQLKEDMKSVMDALDASKAEVALKDEEFNRKVSSINAAFAALAKIPTEGSKVNASPKSLMKKEKDNSAMRNLFEASK